MIFFSRSTIAGLSFYSSVLPFIPSFQLLVKVNNQLNCPFTVVVTSGYIHVDYYRSFHLLFHPVYHVICIFYLSMLLSVSTISLSFPILYRSFAPTYISPCVCYTDMYVLSSTDLSVVFFCACSVILFFIIPTRYLLLLYVLLTSAGQAP
jgi:hypothetical protein